MEQTRIPQRRPVPQKFGGERVWGWGGQLLARHAHALDLSKKRGTAASDDYVLFAPD